MSYHYYVFYALGKPSQTKATNGKKPPLAEMDDLYDVPYEEEIDEARSKLKTEASRPHHVTRTNEKQVSILLLALSICLGAAL